LSMLPTFAFSNNWIAVENLTRTLPFLRSMQRGDIVAFIQPQTLDPVTKRVIGLPGDEIMLEPQDADSRFVRVPKGHVWLEGDNRTTSRDSREYGPVPIALLRGRVFAQVRLPPSLQLQMMCACADMAPAALPIPGPILACHRNPHARLLLRQAEELGLASKEKGRIAV
jgi:inner membrane protease subunit 1